MKTFYIATAVMIVMSAASLEAQPFRDAPAPPLPQYDGEVQEGVDYDVLLHGVVHEAFVEPAAESVEPTIVDRQPPELIEEQPPEVKPEGNRVIWVPGYWAWDVVQEGEDGAEDTLGYVWVSGLWRDVPPDREWVPGQWVRVEAGYQWSPGYWQLLQAESARRQVAYLPAPPASIDRGPNINSPGDDCFWIPGQWTYRHGSYVWSPGFWARQQTGWVWSPARYVCTPHGYVFVEGFWDYEPVSRGQLFGVVVFNRPVYRHVGFRYRPCHAISSSHLMTHLFVSRRGCFYYGNHYTAHHRAHGYRPWYECSRQWHRTSPMVSYYRWQDSCHGRDFDHRMQELRLSVQVSFGRTRTFSEASRHGRGAGRQHSHPVTTVAAIKAAKVKAKGGHKDFATRPNGRDHFAEHGRNDAASGKRDGEHAKEFRATRPVSSATEKKLAAQQAARDSRSRAERLLAAARNGDSSGRGSKESPQASRPGSRSATSIATARERLSATTASASPSENGKTRITSTDGAASRRTSALRSATVSGTAKSSKPSGKSASSISRSQGTLSSAAAPLPTAKPSRTAIPAAALPTYDKPSSQAGRSKSIPTPAASSRLRSQASSKATRSAPKPRVVVSAPKPQPTRAVTSAPSASRATRSQARPSRPTSRPSSKPSRPSRSSEKEKKKR